LRELRAGLQAEAAVATITIAHFLSAVDLSWHFVAYQRHPSTLIENQRIFLARAKQK